MQPTIVVAFTLAFTFFVKVFFTFGEIFLLFVFLTFGLFFVLNIFFVAVFFRLFQFLNIVIFVLQFQYEEGRRKDREGKKIQLVMSSINRERGEKPIVDKASFLQATPNDRVAN